MRILLASDHYPPLIGGAQIQTRLLAQALAHRGNAVNVVTVWQPWLPRLEDDEGISVHRLKQLQSLFASAASRRTYHQPPFADPITALELRRIIRSFRPHLVHSHGWISYSCAVALSGTSVPLVLSARDYGYACARRTLLHFSEVCSGPGLRKCMPCAGAYYGRPKGWIAALSVLAHRRALRRRTTAIHSVSHFVRDVVRRDFLGEGAVVQQVVIPELVPWRGLGAIASPTNGSLDQLPEEPFILFVGALRREKGVRELLAAYRLLAGPPPLVLIGTREPDMPPKGEFPEGTRVLHDFPHAAILSAWDRSLFAVAPSTLPEPLGTVVCEAMSRGKPVIGTKPGGHSDVIVDGETGFLVPRADPVALARAMQRLLDDSLLRERLGANARKRAESFRVDVGADAFENLYRDVLERSPTLRSSSTSR